MVGSAGTLRQLDRSLPRPTARPQCPLLRRLQPELTGPRSEAAWATAVMMSLLADRSAVGALAPLGLAWVEADLILPGEAEVRTVGPVRVVVSALLRTCYQGSAGDFVGSLALALRVAAEPNRSDQ